MPKLITLPSGLSIEIRGLKGKEGRLLTSKDIQKAGNLLERVISACCLKTVDPGPYIITGEQAPDWSKVLTGDILAGVLEIRALSFGDSYSFKTQCGNDACRHPFSWEVNLADLPRQDLPESSKQSFSDGNRFMATFASDSTPVFFKLVTSADSKRMNQRMRQTVDDEVVITSIASRLVDINGNTEKKTFRKILDERDFADLTKLLEDMEAADCGIVLELDTECPKCDAVREVRLPLDQGFFMPVKRKPTAKTRTAPDEDDSST